MSSLMQIARADRLSIGVTTGMLVRGKIMDHTQPVIGYSNKVFISINDASSYVLHSVPSVYHSIYAREFLKKISNISRHVTGTMLGRMYCHTTTKILKACRTP